MMMKLLDRKNKISAEEFKRQAIEIFGNQASEGLPKRKNDQYEIC